MEDDRDDLFSTTSNSGAGTNTTQVLVQGGPRTRANEQQTLVSRQRHSRNQGSSGRLKLCMVYMSVPHQMPGCARLNEGYGVHNDICTPYAGGYSEDFLDLLDIHIFPIGSEFRIEERSGTEVGLS